MPDNPALPERCKPTPIARHAPARDDSEKMRIVLLITAAPRHPNACHAWHTARAILAAGHRLQVFFYGDGVESANRLRFVAQDEENLTAKWAELAQEHGLELPVCVAAAMRRGITDAENARRHQLDGDNLHPAYTLTGLGIMTELITQADRCLTFAG